MPKTTHLLRFSSAARMTEVPSGGVELVVTSPPYPMVEMWDPLFTSLDPGVGHAMDAGEGNAAFARMHRGLDPVWREVARVLRPGGIACINVGDAVRKVGENFQLYPNHAWVTRSLEDLGLHLLPLILWRKTTNKPNKYLGSGMLPGGAYVTLEHEYVIVARKGGKRNFSGAEEAARRQSAYFWEERNAWFSDVWTGLTGARQGLEEGTGRTRSGAYPLELAYRLVNMYSILGDTVLDPFLGTGTTTLAAIAACRNSLGYEIDPGLEPVVSVRLSREMGVARALVEGRVRDHLGFVSARSAGGKGFAYRSRIYGFPVVTRQERDLRLYAPQELRNVGRGSFEVDYASVNVPERPQPP